MPVMPPVYPRTFTAKRKASDEGSSSQYARPAKRGGMASSSVGQQYLKKDKGEVKMCDALIVDNDVSQATGTPASIYPVNLISAGSGYFNRIGRKIKLKGFRLKGRFLVQLLADGTTGVATSQWIRWVLVHDKQPNGSLPNFSTIFGHQGPTAAGLGTSLTDAVNPVQMNRFKILKEGTICCNPFALGVGSGPSQFQLYNIDEYVKARGIETVYSASTADPVIGDISTGAVYLVLRCNDANNVVATQEFSVRTTYYDM